MNIGFIGCGNIAHFHADVLIHLGHTITAVSARPESKNINTFSEKYNVKSKYSSWEEMLSKESFDALWVVAGWQEIDNMLLPILAKGIPTFFEKPVALTAEKLEQAVTLHKNMINKVQIGYNRRFYSFIPEIKNILENSKYKAIDVLIPESVSGITDVNWLNNMFIQNSSHIIDLFYYLNGKKEIEVVNVHKHINPETNTPEGYNGMLMSNGIPVHLISNWNSPSNFGIKFHCDGTLIELLPAEIATIYKGFDVIEPTSQNPIRRYVPKIAQQFFIDGESAKFKPGFLDQTINFFDTCVYNKYENTIGSNLNDILYITKLSKKIM